MDTVTIVIGVAMTAIVIISLVLLGRRGKRTNYRLFELLTIAANRENCQISEYEVFGDFVVGMDKQKNYVFFIKILGESDETHSINLAEIKSCKNNIVSRTVSFSGGNNNVIDSLSLNLIPKDNSPAVELEFYNAEKSTQLNGEFQLIEKWQKIINEQIQGKNK